MGFKCGIVGLPNVGKSTLFNAVTQAQNAAAANYPFCTIDPNVGVVPVPDLRLKVLADIVKPEKCSLSAELFDAAIASGMRSLRHDALEKLVQGKVDVKQARLAYV